jgi:hypothetical protein
VKYVEYNEAPVERENRDPEQLVSADRRFEYA